MELKTKYQYTYFIYPYIVDETNYEKYIRKLLYDKKYTLKIFEKEKDLDLYEYFLPKVKNTMFWSINCDQYRISKFNNIDKNMQAVLLAKYPCAIFEYNIKKDIQGKAGKKGGIFFNITKIEVICFNTGICFLTIKTTLDEESNLSDLCNFNYKFRDINSSSYNFKTYDNIKIQTDMFNDIRDITSLIKEITGNNKGAKELNIDSERFITYSYACVEKECWNEETNKELLEKEFYKFANVEPADYVVENNRIKEKMLTMEKSQYEVYGLTNIATVILTTDIKSENYTKVPHAFEREYLYNYIFELYKKIYLKKLNYEFYQKNKFSQTKAKFIEFTQETWIEEITNNDFGSLLCNNWKKVLDVNILYSQVKDKYDVLYKNSNIEKTTKSNKAIAVTLVLLLIVSVINMLKLFILT